MKSLSLTQLQFRNAALTPLAKKYNQDLSPQERLILSDNAEMKAYIGKLPEFIAVSIGTICEPLFKSPIPPSEDLFAHLFGSCQIKRNVDRDRQENIGALFEYYYDDAFSEAHGSSPDGYRHFQAKLQQHCMHVELSMHLALTQLTALGLYKDDFLFPYSFLRFTENDNDTAIFSRLQGAIISPNTY